MRALAPAAGRGMVTKGPAPRTSTSKGCMQLSKRSPSAVNLLQVRREARDHGHRRSRWAGHNLHAHAPCMIPALTPPTPPPHPVAAETIMTAAGEPAAQPASGDATPPRKHKAAKRKYEYRWVHMHNGGRRLARRRANGGSHASWHFFK